MSPGPQDAQCLSAPRASSFPGFRHGCSSPGPVELGPIHLAKHSVVFPGDGQSTRFERNAAFAVKQPPGRVKIHPVPFVSGGKSVLGNAAAKLGLRCRPGGVCGYSPFQPHLPVPSMPKDESRFNYTKGLNL